MSLLAQPPSPGPQGPARIPCRLGAVLLGSSPEVALHPAHTQGRYFPGISTQESPRLTGCPPGAVCSVDSAEPISWAPGSRGRGMPPRSPADVTAACVPRQTQSRRKVRLELGEHLGKQLEFPELIPGHSQVLLSAPPTTARTRGRVEASLSFSPTFRLHGGLVFA